MHQLNIALLVLGGSALLLGLLSKTFKRWGLPDSVLLLLIGFILGPSGYGLLLPETWGDPMAVLEQAARLALAIGVMGVALRLPSSFVSQRWRSLAVVLAVAMPFMWLCSSGLSGVLLGLPLGTALLLGAALTPTDPVVVSSVVTGPVATQTLPAHLRQIISAESGANDGLAYLFVMFPILCLIQMPNMSFAHFAISIVLVDILGAVLLGIIIGYFAGFLLTYAEKKNIIEAPSVLMFTTALALATLALVKLLGSDGILAVFVAGIAFDRQVDAGARMQEERVVEGVDRFFTSPIFVLLGVMMPWREWLELGWQGLLWVAAILLLRRLPLFLLLGGNLRQLPRRIDGLFAGWFGPLGVAAIYYAALAEDKTGLQNIWPLVSLLVVASVVVHGFTATPFAKCYARQSE